MGAVAMTSLRISPRAQATTESHIHGFRPAPESAEVPQRGTPEDATAEEPPMPIAR